MKHACDCSIPRKFNSLMWVSCVVCKEGNRFLFESKVWFHANRRVCHVGAGLPIYPQSSVRICSAARLTLLAWATRVLVPSGLKYQDVQKSVDSPHFQKPETKEHKRRRHAHRLRPLFVSSPVLFLGRGFYTLNGHKLPCMFTVMSRLFLYFIYISMRTFT